MKGNLKKQQQKKEEQRKNCKRQHIKFRFMCLMSKINGFYMSPQKCIKKNFYILTNIFVKLWF